MASSQDQIQKIIEARNERYGRGFNQLDIDQVSNCLIDKGLIFNDVAMNEYKMEKAFFYRLMSKNFQAMRSLKILETQTTGTLDFTAWEMLIELEYDVDEPLLNIKKGEKSYVRGVSLQWWRWDEKSCNGEDKLSEAAIKGWQIVREHDYMIPLKEENVGVKERLFS